LNESTDIVKGQLLAISRFVYNRYITEQFVYGKQLPETTEVKDILDVVDSYFSSDDLSWKSCTRICTDGVPSVSGSLEGCIVLAKQKNHGIVFTHCFLHIETSLQNEYYLRDKKFCMRRSQRLTTSRADHYN
jgi:hypothetical protein